MTPAEAYKFGFLAKCAADGCSPVETSTRVRMAAMRKSGWALTELLKTILGAGKTALGAAIIAPPALGMLGGYTLAKAKSDDYDPDEAVVNDEIASYYRAIQQLAQAEKRQAQTAR